ncbi:spore germination protein KB [Paenibacillus cellulosilyticus]|uniref:Spore germination protein KB n=1 Tax=Paenibacillus cellulosilyticus TaxID=375489 RepID=A0A2V2YZ77_9BACL|nr:GerAB/ArcD/ProY family transporter [Paenibacillus cellulosilyticus]PWW08288.1 spore germination protein KB [Paenibacillus cellulosilyticus]QKS47888.1 GerAB/ArcD/ProY family transporter [Paenibacillus cellulosilyticus]
MITPRQLASTVILFLIGSSSLFLLGGNADRDAWMSVLVGALAGLLLLSCVTLQIQRLEPDRNLIEIFKLYFGRIIGFVFGFIYVIYYSYKCIRNVREFADLSIMYLLPDTPLSMVILIICFIGGYAVLGGPGVFFRMVEVLLPILVMIYVVLFILLLSAGLIDLGRLMPMLEHGFKPVWDAAIPEIISFPFGEVVLFLMFWRYTAADEYGVVIRMTIKGYVFAGLFITLMNIITIASLGQFAGWSVVPLLQATTFVEISNLLERIDPLVSLLVFSAVYVKLTAYYLGASIAFSYLFRISLRIAAIPVGIGIYVGSFWFKSYMHQVNVGFERNLKYHFPIFQIVIPIVLLLVMLLRKKVRNKSNGASQRQR